MSIVILRSALAVTLAIAAHPTVATGQDASVDSLVRRIETLERRTIELERRVLELEVLLKVGSSKTRPITPSANPQDVANWRRLRRGMRMDDVRAVLGEPERVDAGSVRTYWFYAGGANVYFDGDSGRLEGWSEPIR